MRFDLHKDKLVKLFPFERFLKTFNSEKALSRGRSIHIWLLVFLACLPYLPIYLQNYTICTIFNFKPT